MAGRAAGTPATWSAPARLPGRGLDPERLLRSLLAGEGLLPG